MLKVGDKAPDFEAASTEGKIVKLSQSKGKVVVLYFYPKDDTPGCTIEACNLRDNYSALLKKGIVVLGVSTDTQESHKKFTDKYQLPFPLVADVDKSIGTAYGVYGEKKKFGVRYMGITRTTFLIDKKGLIQHIFTNIELSNHTNQILAVL